MNKSRQDKKEAGIWQCRYWENTIRDETDYNRHMDYIHYNPVRHGYVSRSADWEFSTFLREVRNGRYDVAWGAGGLIFEGLFGE